jgi:anti-sigma-K factor RskA
MPNAGDRRLERQLAFWRVTGLASLAALGVAAALFGLTDFRDRAAGPASSASELVEAAEPAMPERPRLAILQPASQGRVWRVDLDAGMLAVSALPPFVLADPGDAKTVLALWALAPGEAAPRWLGQLDPASTTIITLPDDLGAEALDLVISLEPAGADDADSPLGPILFTGRLEP